MAWAGDEYNDDNKGTGDNNVGPGAAPPGYHYDEYGNLVPDAPALPAFGVNPAAPVAPPVGTPGTYQLGSPNDPNRGGGDGGGGGGGGTVGDLIHPFVGTAPALPGNDTSWLPALPEFHAPKYVAPNPFVAPTGESVLNEPGFKFGMDEGLQGLQQSAAARGVLNGGGTLKDIAAWGQNYAGTKYNDAYGREASTYDRNVLNQNVLPYQYAFQGAQAEFAPKLQGYATQAAAGQRANEFGYNAAMDQYKNAYDQWLSNQQLLYNYRAPFLQG